jgi:hypothetical protein
VDDGVGTLIHIQKILTNCGQRGWSFWESLTLAMVKAEVHLSVKVIHPLVKAVYPLMVGENMESALSEFEISVP